MTDFTGSDTWHTTITGPSAAEDVTHLSVVDMGTLQADREIWLKNRLVGCTRRIEVARVSSGTSAEVMDLVTGLGPSITTFTDVPGVSITLANAVLTGDIIICEVSIVAGHQATDGALSTDRMELAITGSGTSGCVFVLSSVAGAWQTVQPRHMEIRGSDGSAPTIKLRARCATTENDIAMLWGPWDFTVLHLRPVAAP
jgi:hypothetical protein